MLEEALWKTALHQVESSSLPKPTYRYHPPFAIYGHHSIAFWIALRAQGIRHYSKASFSLQKRSEYNKSRTWSNAQLHEFKFWFLNILNFNNDKLLKRRRKPFSIWRASNPYITKYAYVKEVVRQKNASSTFYVDVSIDPRFQQCET